MNFIQKNCYRKGFQTTLEIYFGGCWVNTSWLDDQDKRGHEWGGKGELPFLTNPSPFS